MFGLPDTTLSQITTCISQFTTINWVKIYGSRVKGTDKPGSDIDLAYSASQDVSAALLDALENLPTPYSFDVTHYESISNQALRAHIDRVGKLISSKGELGI